MKIRLLRLLLLLLALGFALGAAEFACRLLPPTHEAYFEDEHRQRITYAEAKQRGLVQEGTLPRGRATWVPGTRFYLCYRGGARPYMDDRGGVLVEINDLGIRDRKELTYDKPQGETRVLCLGDSFTFGWGVPAELAWPRRIEAEFPSETRLRTVNTGAAGTLYVDEYWWALRDRFGRFDPDVVLVTLCLNDVALIPDTINWFRPQRHAALRRSSRLADLLIGLFLDPPNQLRLDPGPDYGRVLLDLPADNPLFALRAEKHEYFWGSGGPQAALRELRDHCHQRGIAFGVVVWPLFQGLERREDYPFHTLHEVVAGFCRAEGIRHLDLLDTFLGRESRSLWVDPADAHGNEIAHALASPPIAAFVRDLLANRRKK